MLHWFAVVYAVLEREKSTQLSGEGGKTFPWCSKVEFYNEVSKSDNSMFLRFAVVCAVLEREKSTLLSGEGAKMFPWCSKVEFYIEVV